jgi:hypothetical protein
MRTHAIIPAMAKMATIPITTPTIQIIDFFFLRTIGVGVGDGRTVTVGRTTPSVVSVDARVLSANGNWGLLG